MCWNLGVTVAMVAAGSIATAVSVRRGDARAIPLTLGYFTLMEALQVAGYLVIDQCGTPANQTVTVLSILHIIFQPFFINAFAMAIVATPVGPRLRTWVFGLCGLAAALMLLQLVPFEWAGTCTPGTMLCGPEWCTRSGDWHLAWDVPYNGMDDWLRPVSGLYGGFPPYMLAVFLLPLVYGAWRFVLFHALAGPVLAGQLTTDRNEVPAIWCLLSIGLVLVALSPAIRRRVAGQGAATG